MESEILNCFPGDFHVPLFESFYITDGKAIDDPYAAFRRTKKRILALKILLIKIVKLKF